MKVPRTTSGGPIFGQVERFFDKTVPLCSLELVNEHIDRRQWAQSKSMGASRSYTEMILIISTRYNKALSRAFLSRARSANNSASQVRFAVGDQVMYWRGNNKRKSQWLGPGIVIGHEGRANVRISHRNAVVKAAGNHVRLAEVEEQLPWHLHDSLRDTDEQTIL